MQFTQCGIAGGATSVDGAALHRLLFPVGPRQEVAIREAGAGSEDQAAFHSFHQGIAKAVEDLVSDLAPAGALRAWLLVREEGIASDMLWGAVADDAVFEKARASFKG